MLGKAKVEFHFFGHYYDPANNNDKIWGWVDCEGRLYNFWGRRGDVDSMKKLTFKRHEASRWGNPLETLSRAKERKGYKRVPLTIDADGYYTDVEKVYPGFTEHVRKQLMFARLAGNVKSEEI